MPKRPSLARLSKTSCPSEYITATIGDDRV